MSRRYLVFAAIFATGCNRYELFRVSGYAQDEFSNDADVLFVVDNSASMQEEAEALALNLDVFVRKLSDPTEGGLGTDGLVDAVDNYIEYVKNREFIVDYQLAITTTDVEHTFGDLYGEPRILPNEYVGDIAGAFNKNLLCEATCFLNVDTLPSDPSYTCADPAPKPDGVVSTEYLDCLCGAGEWENQCGAGTEEHLEAVFMAMCRSVSDPPDECFELNQLDGNDVLSNDGLLRDNSTLIPIIVTDEGDTSRRMSQGDGDPDEYASLYAKFGHRMSWAVIGPNTEGCNGGGATAWGVERLKYFVDDTNGRFFEITEPESEGCGVADFAVAMEQLGELLNGLQTRFVLQSVPDIDSILVFVDSDKVDRASEDIDETEQTIAYGDGWGYDAADNAVEFHGTAVPDYGVDVKIYYRPIQGMPRELPF